MQHIVSSSVIALLAMLALLSPGLLKAQDYDILKECMALSDRNSDIHVCLDNYLDAMDATLAEQVAEVESRSSRDTLTAFIRSQEAFSAFRKSNCLWYLEFSAPRREAELLAKTCLARLSGERVNELRQLLKPANEDSSILRGIYVYGASQNAFRPCGSDSRYWVEGRNDAVGQLQQDYLQVATAPSQVLFVALRGELDDEARTSFELDGVLRLQQVVEVRVPTDSDCRAVEIATAPEAQVPNPAQTVIDLRIPELEEDSVEPVNQTQQLTGYFGAWLAECTQQSVSNQCALRVDLQSENAFVSDGLVTIIRSAEASTQAELRIPGKEIDSERKIRWQVDDELVGDIAQSSMLVDEQGSLQVIGSQGLEQGDLLANMIDGGRLLIEVVDSVDDVSGASYGATLIGLTRALAFADEFIATSE